MRRSFVATAAVLLMTVAAAAQNVPPTGGIVACRTNPGSVALTVNIATNPCWSVEMVRRENTSDTNVTITTGINGRPCDPDFVTTTQLRTTIVAVASVTSLDLIVLDPEGNYIAMDYADIVPVGSECPELPL